MQARFLCLSIVLLFCGCGDPEPSPTPEPSPAPEPFDGTVTFFIAPGSAPDDKGLLSDLTVTFLAVEKPGRTRLVDAWQAPEGAQYGRHRFPAGTSASAVAGYYGGLLANAGWKPIVDFKEGGGSIHFFGATSLRGGSDRPELQVTVSP